MGTSGKESVRTFMPLFPNPAYGAQPGGQLDFRANPHWTASMQYSHFFTGEFLKKTPPGKGVDYFVLSTTFRF